MVRIYIFLMRNKWVLEFTVQVFLMKKMSMIEKKNYFKNMYYVNGTYGTF